jgi:hypothetical protein
VRGWHVMLVLARVGCGHGTQEGRTTKGVPHFHHLDPQTLPLTDHAFNLLHLLLVGGVAADLQMVAELAEVHHTPPAVALQLHEHAEVPVWLI